VLFPSFYFLFLEFGAFVSFVPLSPPDWVIFSDIRLLMPDVRASVSDFWFQVTTLPLWSEEARYFFFLLSFSFFLHAPASTPVEDMPVPWVQGEFGFCCRHGLWLRGAPMGPFFYVLPWSSSCDFSFFCPPFSVLQNVVYTTSSLPSDFTPPQCWFFDAGIFHGFLLNHSLWPQFRFGLWFSLLSPIHIQTFRWSSIPSR